MSMGAAHKACTADVLNMTCTVYKSSETYTVRREKVSVVFSRKS
jgi:hypothetical protein